MENAKKSPIWSLLIMAIPFIYLAMVWPTLPETVPTHFNVRGEADGFGSKNTLLWLPLLLMLPTFLIMEFAPKIDPKQKLGKMGLNYQKFKIVLLVFLAALSLLIIHLAASDGKPQVNLIYAIIGLFFMAIGNYFPTLKPNYFIGIRTPWTLESETVWRNTHRVGGKVFMMGGLMVAIVSLYVNNEMAFGILLGFSTIVTIWLLFYSYQEFKRLEG